MIKVQRFQSVFIWCLCFLLGLIIVSPLIVGFLMSFMSLSEISSIPPKVWPDSFALLNYATAFKIAPLFSMMLNSFIVCAVVIFFQMLTCSFSAYAFTFFEFRYKQILFIIVLSTMMIPQDSIIIANYLTISRLSLTDTFVGLTIPFFTSAMGIFMMRQYFKTVPKELKEASVLDGCTHIQFLFKILLPISTPILSALGIYVFINTYNQFLWPLLVTNRETMRTVQIGISMLQAAEQVNYSVVLAAAVFILFPAIIVFAFGQKQLVKGMTSGAVKG